MYLEIINGNKDLDKLTYLGLLKKSMIEPRALPSANPKAIYDDESGKFLPIV